MILKRLLSKLPDLIGTSGFLDVKLSGIEYDSRRIRPGELFVAIPGMNVDGHKYIDEAIARGASAIIGEKKIDLGPIPYVRVKDSRIALARVSTLFYDMPARKMKIIGVTGTNGKTTSSYLLKSIFEKAGLKTGIIGTLGTLIDGEVLDTGHTTPESLELNKYLTMMVDKRVSHAVVEVSSHSLKLHRVYDIPFEIGVFTNLTQDHLDFHGGLRDYFEAKALLFQNTRAAVLNTDDPAGEELARRLSIPLITYGVEKPADITAHDIKLTSQGVTYSVFADKQKHKVHYGVPGLFSVYNSLAAIGVGISLDLPLEVILEALEDVKGVPGRFETVNVGQPFNIIIDYAHTPDGLENVIRAARGFSKGKIITVFGCGGERDRKKRPIMGRIATRLSDICILTSDNPRGEDPNTIINEIEQGCVHEEYEKISDRKCAIKRAIGLASPGDLILIAGKGHETYQVLKDKVIHFDDKQVVVDILNSED